MSFKSSKLKYVALFYYMFVLNCLISLVRDLWTHGHINYMSSVVLHDHATQLSYQMVFIWTKYYQRQWSYGAHVCSWEGQIFHWKLCCVSIWNKLNISLCLVQSLNDAYILQRFCLYTLLRGKEYNISSLCGLVNVLL
jgi:hypothetical protein